MDTLTIKMVGDEFMILNSRTNKAIMPPDLPAFYDGFVCRTMKVAEAYAQYLVTLGLYESYVIWVEGK